MQVRIEISKDRLQRWVATHLGMTTHLFIDEAGALAAVSKYLSTEAAMAEPNSYIRDIYMPQMRHMDGMHIVVEGDGNEFANACRALEKLKKSN